MSLPKAWSTSSIIKPEPSKRWTFVTFRSLQALKPFIKAAKQRLPKPKEHPRNEMAQNEPHPHPDS